VSIIKNLVMVNGLQAQPWPEKSQQNHYKISFSTPPELATVAAVAMEKLHTAFLELRIFS
jgi:hypothetical protein